MDRRNRYNRDGDRRDKFKYEENVDLELYKNSKEDEELIQDIESFEDLNLNANLLRGIYSNGFEKPSIIQKKAIRPFMTGRDIIAQAQSGVGKTGTFCISILNSIEPELKMTQAIILSPTMELASQNDMVLRKLGLYMNLTYNISIKRVNINENINSLKRNPHIVVGTPGRIYDMINRGALKTDDIKYFILDEADEMLSLGFVSQIKDIFMTLPKDVQVGLYSATMGKDFFEITRELMRNPINILVKTGQLTLEGIKQYKINVERNDYKFETLCDLYKILNINQTMIYCNSKRNVERLTQNLIDNSFTVSYIHGGMSSDERTSTMDDFKKGKTRILVSTDLLSRGIDVQQVSIVINYDIPSTVDKYLHRIGRCGRYGRKGVSVNFMTKYDEKRMEHIEQYYHTIIDDLPQDISCLLE